MCWKCSRFCFSCCLFLNHAVSYPSMFPIRTIYITWILTEVKTSVKLYFCGHIFMFLYARHKRFFQSISATRSNEVKRHSCWKYIVSALSQTMICVCLSRAVCAICLRWTFSSAEVRQKVYTVCVCVLRAVSRVWHWIHTMINAHRPQWELVFWVAIFLIGW